MNAQVDPRETSETLPYSVEIEQALLGAILVDNYWIEILEGNLAPAHFYDHLHGEIFKACLRLAAKIRPATPLTVASFLEGDEAFTSVGGQDYLVSMARAASAMPNVKDYARTLRELAARRDLVDIAQAIAAHARGPIGEFSAIEIADKASDALFKATRADEPGEGAVAIIDLAHRVVAQVEETKNAPRDAFLSTGLKTVDESVGALFRTDLIIVGGATSSGKSSLVVQIAFHCAGEGSPILFFSLEMSGEQVAMRRVSQLSAISSDKLRRGAVTDHQLGELAMTPGMIGTIPLDVDASPGLTVSQIRSRTIAFRRKRGKVSAIVVDHLRFVRPEDDRADEKVQIQQITRDLKALAKELNIPVIVVSHINREAQKRSDHRPVLSDLYGASAIEQNADAVWFVHRESYYLERSQPSDKSGKPYGDWLQACHQHEGKAEIFSAKTRMGAIGTAVVKFDEKFTRFSDIEADPVAVDAQKALAGIV